MAHVCRFVTQDELSSLSSYMRGRLTLDKVTSPPVQLKHPSILCF